MTLNCCVGLISREQLVLTGGLLTLESCVGLRSRMWLVLRVGMLPLECWLGLINRLLLKVGGRRGWWMVDLAL